MLDLRVVSTLALLFIGVGFAKPKPNSTQRSTSIFLKGPLGKEGRIVIKIDPFVKALAKYARNVPLTSFEGDAVLLQFYDPIDSKTSYRHLEPLSAIVEPVYETRGDSTNSDVIILPTDVDNIPSQNGTGKIKRIYVVLRKAVTLHPHLYYVNYLYITEAPENVEGIHNFGGRKVFVEWDFWDNRNIYDPRARSMENALRCSNNIFIPCASQNTRDLPLPFQRPGARDQDNNIQMDSLYPALQNTKNPEQYVVETGYDPEEFIDIYGDLDREPLINRGKDVTMSEVSLDTQPMSPYLVNGSGDVEMIRRAVRQVYEAGQGLVKSFGGLYLGLGTEEAELNNVCNALGIEGSEDINTTISERELLQLRAELKQMTAGGLGGLFTTFEDREAPAELLIDQAQDSTQINPVKSQGLMFGAPYSPNDEEKSFVQFSWTRANGPIAAKDAFVGFGGCRYHQVKWEDIKSASNMLDASRLYQKALKTQCIQRESEFIQDLLKIGLLKFNSEDDKTFDLVEKSLHFTTDKLTIKQIKELLRGVLLAMFSKAYNSELNSPSPTPRDPDGGILSRSVYVIGQMTIISTGYSQIHDWVDLRHGFKLGRNMVRTLKIVYQKLAEDKIILGEGETGFDKEVNYNDRIFIFGLIQYQMRGSTPVYNSGTNPYKNFEQFFKRNKHFFEHRVNSKRTM